VLGYKIIIHSINYKYHSFLICIIRLHYSFHLIANRTLHLSCYILRIVGHQFVFNPVLKYWKSHLWADLNRNHLVEDSIAGHSGSSSRFPHS
jgi:hypothetical protein